MSISSKPIKFAHFYKLANQSMMNAAFVIKVTKACKVAVMKARNSLVVRCREKHVNWKKKETCQLGSKKGENGENIFLKALANRFRLISKLFSRVKE